MTAGELIEAARTKHGAYGADAREVRAMIRVLLAALPALQSR